MYDFAPGEDLDLLVETARSFAEEELAPHAREFEAARDVSAEVRRRYAEIGLAGLELPEALGGAALGAVARALVNEELAAGDPGAAIALDPFGPALQAVLALGGEGAVRDLLLPLLEAPGARAVLVGPGDTTLGIRDGLASGTVPWVPADRVDLLVALTPDGACAVRGDFAREKLRGSGLRAAGASELRLSDANVVASWSGPERASHALARARLHAASLLVGVLRSAADFSRGYAMERVAFGRPIAHHQALAFLIADMRTAVDGARLLVHEAAWHADRGLDASALAAAAFVETVEAASFVGPNAVQILGGHGFMQDYPVEKHMREARTLGLLCGGVDLAREDAGRAVAASDVPVSFMAQHP